MDPSNVLRKAARVWWGLFAWLLICCSSSAWAQPAGVRYVIIVSLDGVGPEALLRARTPNIDALWRNGSYTWSAQTIVPSSTLPAHASMLCGVVPEKHGITWNTYDRSKGFVKVPTVFSIAKAQGFRTAMIVSKIKLYHLAPPGTVDHYELAGFSAGQVAAKAAACLANERPNICLVHFSDADSMGHQYGWNSAEQLAAVEACDRALGVLLSTLWQAQMSPASVMIVTADHGGHDKTHGTARPEDVTIPWICCGRGVRKGYAITTPVRIYDTAATALWALGIATPAEWDGRVVPGVMPRVATLLFPAGSRYWKAG